MDTRWHFTGILDSPKSLMIRVPLAACPPVFEANGTDSQMDVARDHRKTVKHYDERGYGHELTFSCYKRMSLLVSEHCCRLLSVSIDRAIRSKGFSLLAFVFMPEHVHLIVFPERDDARVSALLSAIKRPVSFRIKRELMKSGDPLLEKLTIRERPAKTTFRFWQEGSGYDRNVRDERSLQRMIDYLHYNPVRRGLVDHPSEWKWSSWRYYSGESGEMDVDLPAITVMT